MNRILSIELCEIENMITHPTSRWNVDNSYVQRPVSMLVGTLEVTASVEKHLRNIHTARVRSPMEASVQLLSILSRQHSKYTTKQTFN